MEHRLQYHDLHDETEDNLIRTSMAKKLWVPPLSFKNTDSRPTTSYRDDGSTSLVVIKKEAIGKEAPLNSHYEAEVFDGHKNPIRMTSRFFTTFDCFFNLQWYPFDKQTCYANLSVPVHLRNKLELRGRGGGPNEFRASHILYFEVTSQDIEVVTAEDGAFVLLKIKFTRYLAWYAMSMFIPTLCMVIASEGLLMPFIVFLILVFSERIEQGCKKRPVSSAWKPKSSSKTDKRKPIKLPQKSLQRVCQPIIPIFSAIFVTFFFIAAFVGRSVIQD